MSRGAAIRASMATAPRSRCSHIVDLDIDGARTLFEFDPTGDRAFSVGASSNCDLRVLRDGTPQVAFYLERRADGIWLVPGYRRGELRMNGVAAVTPRRIGRAAVVGFGNVHALITVRATAEPDEASDPPTEVSASTRRSRLSYLESLPDSDDHTVFDPPDSAGPPSQPAERTSVIRATRPAARSARRAQSSAPHLWQLLGDRPFEALAFVLVIGLWITGAALAVAFLLRP
jgi:hypothetical protein